MSDPISRSGAQLLVECLKLHGAELAFGVPGESYLAVLDAFYDTPALRFVACRQEGGAAMMADAYGKLTGRPGLCFVTRGPGATNASAGVHVAMQDSTPLILFIGQISRDTVEREAFQEIDYRRMYGQLAKWVAQIDDPARIPELVSHAFHTATAGRPGPVVLALPEDMLTEMTTAVPGRAYRTSPPHPDPVAIADCIERLKTAQRPLLLSGGPGWSEAVRADLRAVSEALSLPVAATFRAQDTFDNTHDHYVGDVGIGINPQLAQRVRDSDLLLVVGARLGEMTTGGYTLLDIPTPRQPLVHVHPGAEELGRVYQADLPINAGVGPFLNALRAALPSAFTPPWRDWTAAARADYEAWRIPEPLPGPLQLGEIIRWLGERLPADAILSNGAGNYTVWLHRHYPYRGYRSQLAPTSGSMGYGLPAAIAAKLTHPERIAVCLAGDGCLQMTMQEFGTAVQYGAAVIVLVVNNGSWGTIRMHQERRYPGRVSATDLVNPDFVAWAQAYGAYAARVERTEDFAAAFAAALAAQRPALLELCLDLEALTPRATLSAIRATALSS